MQSGLSYMASATVRLEQEASPHSNPRLLMIAGFAGRLMKELKLSVSSRLTGINVAVMNMLYPYSSER